MSATKIIDILPRMINDALNRMNGAYRANDEEAGAAHFERFNKLWDQALERQKVVDASEWRKVS